MIRHRLTQLIGAGSPASAAGFSGQEKRMTTTITDRVTLVIGRTIGNVRSEYIPEVDGYRDGARQVPVTLTVDKRTDVTGEQWAEAVYIATRSPGSVILNSDTALAVHDAIIGEPGDAHVAMPVLTMGDTVTVDGVRYCRDASGWVQR
jgi:hypothetical protein